MFFSKTRVRLSATALVLVALLLLLQANSRPVQAQSGNALRTAVAPAARVVKLPRLSAPPTRSPDELAGLRAASAKTHVRTHPAAADSRTVHPRAATALAPTIPTPLPGGFNPGDFGLYQTSDLQPAVAGNTSVVDEPSVGNIGPYAFETGNWFGALSSDYGNTWSYVDPYTAFPHPSGQRFCCDQSTLYSPSRNLYVWLTLYLNTTTNTGPGTLRIAVANGPSGLASLNFHYYDFTPQDGAIGFPAGDWYDYPYLALSNSYLYVSANVFKPDGVTFDGTVILRLPLDSLAATGPFAYSTYVIADKDPTGQLLFNATLTQGATDTMYWATHYTNAALRVYAWPESGSVSAANVAHTPYSTNSHFYCGPAPNSPGYLDWCGRLDDRVLTAWVSNGILGFMWDGPQGSTPGGFGTFSYPYVQSALISQSGYSLLAEPLMYNSNYAFAYAGVGLNARGHVAGAVFYGGGTTYPSVAAFLWDDLSPTPFPNPPATWQTYAVLASTQGPIVNQWGDYLTARQNYATAYTRNSWIGTGYTLTGGGGDDNIHPYYLVFGRQRDNPLSIISSPLVVFHLNTETINPTVGLTLSNNTAAPAVTWTATPTPGVTLSSTGGTFSSNTTIQVTVAAVGKSVGTYAIGSITISANDNLGNSLTGGPRKVPVILIVGSKFSYLPQIFR